MDWSALAIDVQRQLEAVPSAAVALERFCAASATVAPQDGDDRLLFETGPVAADAEYLNPDRREGLTLVGLSRQVFPPEGDAAQLTVSLVWAELALPAAQLTSAAADLGGWRARVTAHPAFAAAVAAGPPLRALADGGGF